MTLVTRVSTFFLIALAIILVGFSVTLYGVSRYYLSHQFDRRLNATLNTLVAAIEVEDDDVKWEPTDHTVTLGTESGEEDIRWVVSNEQGQIIEQSRNLQHSPSDRAVLERSRRMLRGAHDMSSEWRFLQHRLAAPHPKPVALRDTREHAELLVTVALSENDLRQTLHQLAVLLVVLPAACWGLAAIGGRWFCSQAIEPVRRMAASARAMSAEHTDRRLPVTSSGDEVSELGLAFNGLLDQLFQAYERQRQFAGDAAHQLRTPLTVLQGQIDVALRRTRTAEEYQTTLEVVRGQVGEFREMIEALLFLARSPDDQALQADQPLDLTLWFKQYPPRWQSHPRSADLSFQVDDNLTCDASPELLRQLFDNLIGNALKYSPADSPVTVSVERRERNIVVDIADRGRGIPHEEVELIFQPFYRTTDARQSGTPGTGLGLSIVSRIVSVLRGGIDCQSQIDQGTRFTVTLPVTRDDDVTMQVSDRSGKGRLGRGHSS